MSWLQFAQGASRFVVLIGGLAFKFPHAASFERFLHGLLANMQESTFSKAGWPELCPVLFSLPGGLLVVMPRCTSVEPIWDSGWMSADEFDRFRHQPDYTVPVENKSSSFGYLKGRLVALDYGS